MICGIDFGTSNSTLGVMVAGKPRLLPLEGEHVTLPSAVFYDEEERLTRFGRDAVAAYAARHEGRLLRALKSVLGSALVDETTQIAGRQVPFTSIIGDFLAHLKARAEKAGGSELTQVVLGRPVHFVDGDDTADRKAQEQLEQIAGSRGFKEIAFQYEPVAAALDYERAVSGEELVLVADIGGGTSDFSLVRVGPSRAGKPDRRQDILANTGVHVGGTDFDYRLSVGQVMPLLGLGSLMRLGNGARVAVPAVHYHDLATWHRIVFLYTRKCAAELASLRRDSLSPGLLERLHTVVESQLGHYLASRVEAAKVALSAGQSARVALDFIEADLQADLDRGGFEAAIGRELAGIEGAIGGCMAKAGIAPDEISAVFLTGGSTAVPAVHRACTRLVPQARIVEGDKFGSVGLGLAMDAGARFGG